METKEEYKVKILPERVIKTFSQGTILQTALEEMGFTLPTPCGGKGICKKCTVKIKTSEQEPAREVLSCKTEINSHMTVFMESSSLGEKSNGDDRIDLTPGKYLCAVDMGTTTINIILYNRDDHTTYELPSFLNPQRKYGHDVISRIASSEKSEEMKNLLINDIINRLKENFQHSHIPFENLEKIAFAGNSAITYILQAIDLSPLGRAPYEISTHVFKQEQLYKLLQQREDTPFGRAERLTMPVYTAFLGGDFSAGLTYTLNRFDKAGDKNIFFIDLGTNGEMFIKTGQKIIATSCAMGPALEGMNINCGMTAARGAIREISEQNGKLNFSVIGEATPLGLAGSGVIDLLYHMLDKKAINSDGNLIENPIWKIEEVDEEKRITIHKNIYFSQKDIRQVQLARGALLAASEILLKESQTKPEDIELVIIAGTFGKHINMENFKALKFLPEFPQAEFKSAGNTSLKGTLKAMKDNNFLQETIQYKERVSTVDLTSHKDFNDQFIRSLNF